MSSDSINLTIHAHHSIFFTSAAHALESSHLTDVVIATGTKQFLAHKLILSSFSGYFHRLFNKSSMDDHNYAVSMKMDEVHMEDMDPTEMELLLHYMYYGEVNVHQSDVMDFLKTAEHFQIKGLCDFQLESSLDELINNANAQNGSKTQKPNILKRKSSTSLNCPIKKTRFVNELSQAKKCLSQKNQSFPKERNRNGKVKTALGMAFIELKREKEENIKEYKKLEKAEERLSAKCFEIQCEKNAVDMENKVFKEFIELEEAKMHTRLQLKEIEANVVKYSGNRSTLRSEWSQKNQVENEDTLRDECTLNPILMILNNIQKTRLTKTLRKLERKSLKIARKNPMLGTYSLLSRKYDLLKE